MPIAALLACVFVGIADGDTLTARCDTQEGQISIVIRLADVDAPEKGQAWGNRSRENLTARCFKKQAVLKPRTRDRYGRMIARVECVGMDASEGQVRDGMAWVFDQYVNDVSLYVVQDEARKARRGLWADAEPVPPWE